MKNGITLIALIITIIVLLILAGVSINLVIGENGILKQAKDATTIYAQKEQEEKNALDQLYDEFKKQTALNADVLKAGDYVYYDSGSNGVILCRVLYPKSSPYGLQIISHSIVKNYSLCTGADDTYVGDYDMIVSDYNNVIEALNNQAMVYLNTKYGTDARCVGSNPINKNAENTTTVLLPFTPNGWSTNDSGLYGADTNYEADWNALQVADMYIPGNDNPDYRGYFLASRGNYLDDYNVYSFYVNVAKLACNLPGRPAYEYMCSFYNNLYNPCYEAQERGLRPVITLKSDIKVTGGNGTSSNPYTLGIYEI